MYICKNCGNKEKFIGYAEEKGNAIILQNPEKNMEDYCIKDASSTKSFNIKNKINHKASKSFNYKDYTWLYAMSDNSWKGRLKITKCYFCLSERIEIF